MEDTNVKENEVEEIETTEMEDDSNAGAFLAGVIGGFIAYAAIEGAKKIRMILLEKWKARKSSDPAEMPVETEQNKATEEEAVSDKEESEE